MKSIRPGLTLLLIQLLLVVSVAGKYLYERETRPRVWVRATQFDPYLMLRGRYLALQLLVDACSLPRDNAHLADWLKRTGTHKPEDAWVWDVSLAVDKGHLVPRLEEHPRNPEDVQQIRLFGDVSCDRTPLSQSVLYFIPDSAKSPLPSKPGEELWVEVTVPAKGPPRPTQLAISSAAGFKPLKAD